MSLLEVDLTFKPVLGTLWSPDRQSDLLSREARKGYREILENAVVWDGEVGKEGGDSMLQSLVYPELPSQRTM